MKNNLKNNHFFSLYNIMLSKYIAGNSIKNAISISNKILKSNKIPVINYAVESSKNKINVFNEYKKLSYKINNKYRVALKLSSFDFDENLINKTIDLFKNKNIKILIDAENNILDPKYQETINKLILKHNTDNIHIIKTYQMYRNDSLNVLKDDLKFFDNNNNFLGIKLVRGAYWNSEKNDGHLFFNKFETDFNYNLGIYEIFKNNNNKILPILATHNTESINLGSLLNYEKQLFEFGHLMGMKESKYKNIKYPINTYIPYGPYNEMIPYLLRRLYENKDTIKYMLH